MSANLTKSSLKTHSGLDISVLKSNVEIDEALEQVFSKLDHSKGAIFSSGLEYPGKHSRWDIGFVNPAIEFISRGRTFSINALNPQGEFLLKVISPALEEDKSVESFTPQQTSLVGSIATSSGHFSEEERTRQPSVFTVLRTIQGVFKHNDKAAEMFGFYGAFGYDLVLQFEDLELKHKRDVKNKDCHLFLPLELVVVDRQTEIAFKQEFIVSNSSGSTADFDSGGQSFTLEPPQGDSEIKSDHAPGEFAKKVAKVLEGTKRGDYFEVVLSQCFETRRTVLPMELFHRLSEINPSPYLFCINLGDEQLIGSSPEIYVRVTDKRYETCPIAGTVKRGDSALEDADQVRQLISSLKDESELTMCTDVDRNDMARVCIPGSVRVIGRRQLEFYSHLIHTVDHVCGELADGYDSLDAFQTHMWACTVTGAPKPAALQEIENLELNPRGWYSGAIGLLLFNGNINTGITLRTAHLKDGRASTRSGATLLYGSNPEDEEQETLTKAGAFLAAISSSPIKSLKKRRFDPEDFKLKSSKRILLVDCRDSFVHNLASYMRELGCDVHTVRSGYPESVINEVNPDLVFFSPGPGSPEEFGIPNQVKALAERNIPIFGVCLGHQGIAQAFGAEINELPGPRHGKTSQVRHNDSNLFEGIGATFEVGRYHSLCVNEESLPDCLEITARTIVDPDNEADRREGSIIMGLRHKTLPIAGVQFHPESLMTLKQGVGYKILFNAIKNLC